MHIVNIVCKDDFDWSKDIVIQTPYLAQRKLIRHLLNEAFHETNHSRPADNKLEANDICEVITVDNLQGSERRAMINDVVISHGNSWSDLGFLDDDN